MSEYRAGIGWDVHRLVAGRPLILGGVTVPSELGLEGHSDADVLSDYRDAIRQKLADALGLELDRVSVKFKTAEKVGPVGEGRSAEAQAVVSLLKLGTGPFHERGPHADAG